MPGGWSVWHYDGPASAFATYPQETRHYCRPFYNLSLTFPSLKTFNFLTTQLLHTFLHTPSATNTSSRTGTSSHTPLCQTSLTILKSTSTAAMSNFTTDEQLRLYYGKLNRTIAHKLVHMNFDEFQRELLWSYFKVFVARLKMSDVPSAIGQFVGVKTFVVST